MKEKKIEKGKVGSFIKGVAEKYELFGPVKREDHHVFARINSPEEIDFHYLNSLISPKGLFFPQSETLYRFRDDQVMEEPLSPERERAVMFMRPCDARALTFLDKVFRGTDFEDPYYLHKRTMTTVISLACNRPLSTCFCTSLEGNPADEEGADVVFFDLGDSFFIKAISEKGEKFLEPYEKLFGEAQKSDLEKVNKRKEKSEKKVASTVPVTGLKEKLSKIFAASLWEDIHRKCLGCGTCTYLCATCYCFDITDEVTRTEGRRIRSWDSCLYPLFTLHASGHNPRPSGKERMRQRIMHKFNYCPENFAVTFCVGCGRCVRACPVNLDIRQVINTIKNAK